MEQFLPVYPSLDNPDIQHIITQKKEFRELAAKKEERLPPGGFYNHQKFFVRFMVIADRILNIHEPGTGKTCAFISATEYFKKSGTYHKAYIVENGETITNDIKDQIVRKCTKGDYDFIEEGIDTTARGRQMRISKALNKWYEFKTYQSFATELSNMKDDDIIAKFSKNIFIFDEVHNILSDKVESTMYKDFHRLCMLVKQSKICTVTATPMLNDVSGAARLINLLLPPSNQITGDLNLMSLSEMEKYFRGKITFVRSSLISASPNYVGQFLPAEYYTSSPDGRKLVKSGIKIYPTQMGDIQRSIYDKTINVGVALNNKSNAGIFTFPFAEEEDFIQRERGSRFKWVTPQQFSRWEHRGDALSFEKWLYNKGDTSNLGRLSGKIKSIVDIERDSPGCSFIFSHNDVKRGALLVGMILKIFGFEIFDDPPDKIFIDDTDLVRESYVKKKRVAIISGTFESRIETIKRLFNSDANVNGEYIKIICGSKKTRDGINLYHCLRMHLLHPAWNFSSMIQATNRVLRAAGHDTLQLKLIKDAKEKGLTGKEFDDYTKITVNIYRHCIGDNLFLGDTSNVDLHEYKKAEEKELKIRRVLQAMKICAVDSLVNRDRNWLDPGKDYTQECDYEECNYPAWEEVRNPSYNSNDYEIDNSTYTRYQDTNKLKKLILSQLIKAKTISFEDIFDKYTQYEIDDILKTLNDIKMEFSDKRLSLEKILKFYEDDKEISEIFESLSVEGKQYDGDDLFVIVGENEIFLQRQIDISTPFIRDLSIYENPISIINNKSSVEVFKDLEEREIYIDVENIKKLYVNSVEKAVNYIKNLDRWRQKNILENLQLSSINLSNFFFRQVADKLLEQFTGYLFKFEDAFVHTFQPYQVKGFSHSIVVRSRDPKDIWILKRGESIGWRNAVSETEYNLYRNAVKKEIKNVLEKYEKYPIYGSKLQDNKFRIGYNPLGQDIQDRRQVNRGIECDNLKKPDLIRIALDENISPTLSSIKYPSEEIMRSELEPTFGREYVKMLKGNILTKIYDLNRQPDIKTVLCTKLEEKLTDTGRMYIPYRF